MSESRRNRRKNMKNKKLTKNEIPRKEKLFGILALVVLFIAAVILSIYLAYNRAF